MYNNIQNRKWMVRGEDGKNSLPGLTFHTPKMLIIQFHASSVWRNACHTIFIQFLKMVEKRHKHISVAV